MTTEQEFKDLVLTTEHLTRQELVELLAPIETDTTTECLTQTLIPLEV